MTALPEPFVELVAMARAYRRSRALSVAAELGVADHLADGPVAVEALAVATGTDTEALYRLLRALASVGVFHEGPVRTFALGEAGDYLRSDHPLSVAPIARHLGADYEWASWGELLHSIRTGENAAVHALGTDVWEHRRRHPGDSILFDAAMRTFSAGDAPALLDAHDFGRYGVIADIGGGTGALLAALLRAVPSARGILFDQPQVVAGAGPELAAAGVADRVYVVAGSFFESVPAGADAYVLRRILHDWTDDRAVEILRCIRRSIGADARLLVVDAVVGGPNEDPQAKFLDLGMLVSAGGRERTDEEWAALLGAGGFARVATTPATGTSHVIEAVPDGGARG
ncbi:MAG: methyltransferase [Acidimicrobiia bacterium]